MLILLGGTITTESSIIELTPNFIGSLLLLSAMKDFQIKDDRIQRSLYILTGIFLLNYILQIQMLDGIVSVFSSILAGGTLIWGVYLAIKLVEQIKGKKEITFNSKPLITCFWVLLAVIIVIEIAVVILTSMPISHFVRIIVIPWTLALCAFIGMIARYRLIYLFYKELKCLNSNK